MEHTIANQISYYRQLRKMTQEEFASRIGVTPQAVSKWERGNSLPDLLLLPGIVSVLGVSADTLLGIGTRIVENGDSLAEKEIKNNLTAEPFVLEFGEKAVPVMISGLKTDYVNQKRVSLAKETGMLLPVIRLRDNLDLEPTSYRILIYDAVVLTGSTDNDNYQTIIDKLTECCKSNYAKVLNKQLVKTIVDNLKAQFPGVADGLIPEKISYLTLERRLQKLILEGKSIRDIIHIIEELEETLEK